MQFTTYLTTYLTKVPLLSWSNNFMSLLNFQHNAFKEHVTYKFKNIVNMAARFVCWWYTMVLLNANC